jgi:son of sevenless-like protein
LPSLFEAPPDDFVIALHDYTAPPSSRTHIYLSFQVGCRIRVWNRDESGWWDGEVVNDPEGREVDATYGEQFGKTGDGRGWFPSNFVEEEGPDSRVSSLSAVVVCSWLRLCNCSL